MVLEEHKTSEHNSAFDAQQQQQQQQQDLSAAQKKMSLASKLRKQRRIRASGSKSPVPNETPLPSTSKSPVPRREQNQEESLVAPASLTSSSSRKSESRNHHQNAASEGHSNQNNDNDNSSSSNAPKKAASSSSMGSSILHNKRRAMNLAKSRRSGASSSNSTAATSVKKDEAPPASYSPYSRTKPAVTTNANSNVVADPNQEPSSSSSVVHHTNSNDHDVSPVPSAVESELEAQPEQPPEPHRAAAEERPYENPEVVPWDAEEPSESEIPAPPSFHPNSSNSVVAMPLPVVDDSDRFSQVSLGRSVVSNGVVDYDESIMNLARLDNFRSKTNQTRASQSKARQESSYNPSAAADTNAVPKQISAQVSESVPSSASKAVRQWNPPASAAASSSTSNSRMTAKQSWRARSPSPVVKDRGLVEQQPVVSSAKKFSRQPSWIKKNNAAPAEEHPEEAPASPTPSQGQYSRPGSPARSVFSSTSRPTSPLLNMPKFSGARSDIGVSHSYSAALPMMPMPSASTAAAASASSATRSWRASSPVVTKRSLSLVPPVCPGSPTPSNVSEVESTLDSNNINNDVPKAKAWSAKKQQPAPAWAKRSMSSGALSSPKHLSTTSPRKQSSVNNKNKSWMSSPVPPTVSSPRRHSAASPAPSWVKPPKTEQSAAAAEKPPSIPTAKSWAANKQTPAWMKKAQGGEEQPMEKPPSSAKKSWSAKKAPSWTQQQQANSNESEKAATPSPRRNSIPSWMKPGHPTANATEHQNGEKTIVGSPQLKKEKFASVSSPQTPSWKARTSSSPGETKRSPSPRAQSWKPASPTAGGGPSSARKNRHSIAGASASASINCQRSPSPGVAQLQEQIFVTKLGVVGDSQKKALPRRAVKGPSSPSPQVKQLQKIIFSPDKGGTGDSEERTSPAAGWWKRIPNAPEVKTSNSSETKFESSSSVGGGEECTDVPPSPTRKSEPASFPSQTQKAWKSPKAQAAPGTPTWLQDVAAFHSGNTPKNLPSQPPVWQDEAPNAVDTSEAETRSMDVLSASPKSEKVPMDEEQSETKMSTPTSTTSRDDSSSQQEDTKSLIQMAADSVLVIDYEQAMQRAGMDSRESDDGEDESADGNSDDDALPSDLPLEFQKALTFEDKRESEFNAQPLAAEADVLPASEEPVSTDDVNAVVSNYEIPLEADQPHTQASVPTSSPKEISETGPPQQEIAAAQAPSVQPQVEEARSQSAPQETPVPEQAAFQDDMQSGAENIAVHSGGPTESHSNKVEYDENGFPVSGGNDASATFAQDDFAADAFGSQPWTENPGDEKKEDETNKILQYWAPEVNAMNDSSEWADRDPGLDSIAMASPEPKTTEKVLATAERVLKKWEDSPLVQVNTPEEHNHHVSPTNLAGNEGWGNNTQSPHHSPGKQQTSDDAMWSVDQFTAVQATEGMPPPQKTQNDGTWGTPQPPKAHREPTAMAPDPMWGSVEVADAAWGVPQPDPFSPPQFDMPAPTPNKDDISSGDVFDPFGSEEDELFSDPTESIDPFAAPSSFVPTYSHEGIPLRPVSQEELDGHDLQMI